MTLDVEAQDHFHVTPVATAPTGVRTVGDTGKIHLTIMASGRYVDAAMSGTPVLRTRITEPDLRAGQLALGTMQDTKFTPSEQTGQSAHFTNFQIWEP